MNLNSNQALSLFNNAYDYLNKNQRQATDALEGPVMVIAGPGTGKTQILAVRIGNILLKTDAGPKNILCLTYTEAGATAMRQRLLSFIGPQAYDVSIHTFHSFCNKIIRENPEEFLLMGEYDAVSDLEKKQILQAIVHNIPKGNILFDYKGNYDFLIQQLENLFSDIKKENWDVTKLIQDIDQKLEEMKSDEAYIYKRASGKNAKGDFNENKYLKDKKPLDRSKEAASLYFQYEKLLNQWQRYDYEDMIRWVLKKFQSDEDFLAKYQERFQYILVDEYQDTNGVQNQILYQLLSYWENPNVFVVGDDDQAIFRFQGANVTNMLEFYARYQPEIIILTENYRSTQTILDHAAELIKNNTERLIHAQPDLNKILLAVHPDRQNQSHPKIIEYENPIHETAGTFSTVKSWIDQGVPLHEIAILYRKNKDAESFIKLFQHHKIAFSVTKEVSVLDEIFIRHILNFFHFFANHQKLFFAQDDVLCEMILAPFVKLSAEDLNRLIWKKTLEKRERKESFEEDPNPDFTLWHYLKTYEDSPAGKEFVLAMESLIVSYPLCTPQVFFEQLLIEMQILPYILNHGERNYLLQLIHTLFELIKKETALHPDWTLKELMEMIDDMIANKIILQMEYVFGSKNGIQLSTLFKAKGLEYSHVCMIKCNEKEWKKPPNRNLRLPDIYKKNDDNNAEDDRRLFFVGITRAKQELQISFSGKDANLKDQMPCSYVSEVLQLNNSQATKLSIDSETMADNLVVSLSPFKKDFAQLEENAFNIFLERFAINPTALTKYLECPLAFYYENVLRIPMARKPVLGFGSAIHQSLDRYFRNKENRERLDESYILKLFKHAMDKYHSHFTTQEFENYSFEGERILPLFVNYQLPIIHGVNEILFEESIQSEILSVPVSGKLDRIDITPTTIRIVDYKTGSPNAKQKVIAPSEKNENGSAYWLQMMFYILLLKQKPQFKNKAISSIFYFVSPDGDGKFKNAEVHANETHQQHVESLIVKVYQKIKEGIFTPGCQKPQCKWCNYINTKDESGLLQLDQEDYEEEEEG